MTYQNLITLINSIIREQRSWPEGAAGDKLDEQLDMVFGATLAVARELPMEAFRQLVDVSESEEEMILYGKLEQFALPADRFVIRPDHGLALVVLGHDQGLNYGWGEKREYMPTESVSRNGIREASGNPWQFNNPMFHIDLANGQVYVSGASSFQLKYIPTFTRPSSDNQSEAFYETLDFPMPKPYDRQVANLVAMEINGVLTGDRTKSAIHKALADYYGRPAAALPTASEVSGVPGEG